MVKKRREIKQKNDSFNFSYDIICQHRKAILTINQWETQNRYHHSSGVYDIRTCNIGWADSCIHAICLVQRIIQLYAKRTKCNYCQHRENLLYFV